MDQVEQDAIHSEIADVMDEVSRFVAAGGTVAIPPELQDRLTAGGEGDLDPASLRKLRDDVRGLRVLIRQQGRPSGQG